MKSHSTACYENAPRIIIYGIGADNPNVTFVGINESDDKSASSQGDASKPLVVV